MIAQRDEYTSTNSIHEGIYLSANHNAQDEVEELNTEKVPILTNNEGGFYDQALTAKQIRKACRNSGKAYVTSSGKCMPPKKVTPLSECRAKCNTRFTFEMQQAIFNDYWNLGSYDKRAAFVSSMIAVSDKKSIRPRTYEARKEKFRTKTYGYSLVYGEERLPTCKGCFLKTLDESEGMIKTVAHKKRANPTGILCDMRGKSSLKQDGFDVHIIPAKTRKILGMNSQLSASNHSNLRRSDSLENCFAQESVTTPMDRMRFANIMNQEMHSIFPYGTFLSPVLPAPNLALPYALTPNMPYAAVPLYQTVGTAATTSGGGSNQQQSQQNSNCREPSKMLIQIGLQCVNQNNPININSMNDMTTSLGKVNLHFDQAETGKKDSSSMGSSPISSCSKDKDIGCDFNNNSCSTLGAGDPSHVTLSQAKFEELKTLALTGSEIAEKLAYTHRNRPCFKKIDSLCARMKQDLIRPDGVLPNINSQGIAWAVKDFIFVFTRVINAWIIIKGYVYNTPEGLNKVRSALSPDFVRSFADWQDSTVDFVENLMKSFVNLDNLVQAQKNVYQKVSTTPMKCSSDETIDFMNTSLDCGMNKETTINKNYMYTMVEDSDVTQRQNTLNGTYFKTGTYNFIKRESKDEGGSTGLEQFFDENFAKSMPNICPTYDLSPTHLTLEESKLNCDIRVLENKLSKFSAAYDPILPKPLGKDLVDKLNVFMNRLMEVKSADLFFKIQFCRNYFPDFISKTPDFVDLRAIILKCQTGGYGHIFEVVHDIKLIIYQARMYLNKHPHPELEKAIISFEADVEKILAEEPFENYQFEHIKGKPNEVLYNSGK